MYLVYTLVDMSSMPDRQTLLMQAIATIVVNELKSIFDDLKQAMTNELAKTQVTTNVILIQLEALEIVAPNVAKVSVCQSLLLLTSMYHQMAKKTTRSCLSSSEWAPQFSLPTNSATTRTVSRLLLWRGFTHIKSIFSTSWRAGTTA